jgi:hypothetical protein
MTVEPANNVAAVALEGEVPMGVLEIVVVQRVGVVRSNIRLYQ